MANVFCCLLLNLYQTLPVRTIASHLFCPVTTLVDLMIHLFVIHFETVLKVMVFMWLF
jgi:hypothetical protein